MDIDTNMAFALGDRIRWVPEKLPDWARDCGGRAVIAGFKNEQPCFGPPGSFDPGPAYALKLDGRLGLEVWVPPEEVMPLLEEVAA